LTETSCKVNAWAVVDCGLFVCCFIWVKIMLKLINFIFTWGYSLHGKTHTISINMAVALTWGFVYLLTILKKKTRTKNWNNISQQVVLTMIS
jgi:hypothetical protein